ncbi:MAG: hypothetical protein PUD93_10760 [Lachnospiraceae bacterium]|nr:hypothetical protein [Lachnospiraceae bacterium]
MKAKLMQKVLAGALTVALVAAPSMSVFASGAQGSGSNTCGGSSTTTEAAVVEIVNAAVAPTESSSGSGSGTVSSIAEIPTTSSVAGVKTSVAGVYMATSVNGTAITTGLADIASSYGLAAGEKPYARIYNMDTKKSPLAAAAIDQAAAAKGAVVGPYVNVELGKLSSGKFSLLASEGAPITLKFGIPKSFAQDGKTFAVVCVRPGGAVSILEDTDTNPNTVTFNTTGGQGAYAIIKY